MGLYFHPGKDRKAASRKQPTAFLDESVWFLVLGKISRYLGSGRGEFVIVRCPLLNRLQDIYGNCSYDVSELNQLINEIREIKQEFVNNNEAVISLEVLEKACCDARNGNLNLYIFGD